MQHITAIFDRSDDAGVAMRARRPAGMNLVAATATTLLALSACSVFNHRTTEVESAGEVTVAPATPANNRSLPVGATLLATLDQALGTRISRAGDPFTATVSSALMAQDGSLVVPEGAKIAGHVTALDDSDNPTEPALIRLQFDRLRFAGYSYPFAADIVRSNPVLTGQSNAQRTRQIVIGGAVGAALGGLLGKGDLDKLVIGGALGAAAGSIVSLGTDVDATLPAGSAMTVRATRETRLR
jgi:hypothetical protein